MSSTHQLVDQAQEGSCRLPCMRTCLQRALNGVRLGRGAVLCLSSMHKVLLTEQDGFWSAFRH